jgi:hypothetical protein
MKTLKTVLLGVLVLMAITATCWAQANNATKASIIGSPHDLTTYTFATGGGTAAAVTTNTCFFCHIIHKTAANRSGIATTSSLAPGYLLWNHQLSAVTAGTYGIYSSDTFQAIMSASGGAASPTDLGNNNNITSPTVSNLCLSCHDGTVAIVSLYEQGFGLPANGSTWTNTHGTSTYMYNGFQISDLTKSHPVHFQYTPGVAAAAGMKSPLSTNSVNGDGAVPLYGGAYYMECPTCHDPHNGTTLASGTAVPFGRQALMNAESASTGGNCTYCHT